MNVPFVVRIKNQYNSHGALFIRRCGTLSDTPSRISSLIHLHVVLSLLEFLLGDIFLFCLRSVAANSDIMIISILAAM